MKRLFLFLLITALAQACSEAPISTITGPETVGEKSASGNHDAPASNGTTPDGPAKPSLPGPVASNVPVMMNDCPDAADRMPMKILGLRRWYKGTTGLTIEYTPDWSSLIKQTTYEVSACAVSNSSQIIIKFYAFETPIMMTIVERSVTLAPFPTGNVQIVDGYTGTVLAEINTQADGGTFEQVPHFNRIF